MVTVEEVIPGFVLEWSLAFKSAVIVLGAVLLLFSTLIRPIYPILWIVPFFFGALVEWLIVATVYTEMSQMEGRIDQTKVEVKQSQSEIESTQGEIEETKSEVESTQIEVEDAKSEIQSIQNEIQDTKEEIEGLRDDTFSTISDSQGSVATDSIEDRLSKVENEVGLGGHSLDSLERRVSDLERSIEKFDRGGRF